MMMAEELQLFIDPQHPLKHSIRHIALDVKYRKSLAPQDREHHRKWVQENMSDWFNFFYSGKYIHFKGSNAEFKFACIPSDFYTALVLHLALTREPIPNPGDMGLTGTLLKSKVHTTRKGRYQWDKPFGPLEAEKLVFVPKELKSMPVVI